MKGRMARYARFVGFLARVRGKRIAIGGNRRIAPGTQKQIGKIVKMLLARGCSVVTGGAEGADHAAMRACLKRPKRITVFLPGTIENQYERYRKIEGAGKAKLLLSTLLKLKKSEPGSIIENRRAPGDYRKAASLRNSAIVRHASGFIVLRPGGSRGSADALSKIRKSRKPCLVIG